MGEDSTNVSPTLPQESTPNTNSRTFYPYSATSAPTVSVRTKFFLALGFAWIAGFVDVICLIRYKALPSMMTGNLIQLGRSLVEEIDAVFLIALICCRMGGLAIHYFAERRFAYGTTLVAPLLGFTIISLEYIQYKCIHVNGTGPLFHRKYDLLFMAPVFGVQQAVSMQGCLACPTTLATGHLANLTYSIIDLFLGKGIANVAKFACDCAIVLGLAGGALVGSCANTYCKETVLHDFLLSIGVLPLILLFAVDDYLSTPPVEAPDARHLSFQEKLFSRPAPLAKKAE
eukprot:gnl/MRDRNA2_/MRDRNA2_254611_c0_seq1.p1 gnl/MRDRNA2_/MRDRNA2_254611_c0~~gnl/MRDRNA2_/MRDRNA2_254611_c0_seq1.p1  ORF type:complete len:287 (-),score=11.55 gnl/MRDRNA2_/MRDRNA2_254611_c0_seq1:96-956(-)